MRAFIAFDFSEKFKSQLYEIQKSVKSFSYSGSWVSKNNFHLTLKFLGEIDNKHIEDIDKILKNISNNNEPISIQLNKLGFFNKKNNEYKVIWVGFGGELDRLISVFDKIDEQTSKIGFNKEKRKFKPHITLGRRLKTDFDFHQISEKVNTSLGKEETLKKLVLMKSEVIMNKRVYTPIVSYNLIRINKNNHR